ncbi:hypothetical protein H311_05265, partial [Anncaliia algerae PRA109]
KRVFYCKNIKCKNKRNLRFNSIFTDLTIEFKKIIRIIYSYVFELNLNQALYFCEVSKPTYIKAKDRITQSLILNSSKIGGAGLHVHIDEIAIYNGLIIKN